MKLPLRLFLIIICAVMIVCLPFLLTSPSMLHEAEELFLNDVDDEEGETLDFGRVFLPAAAAEEAEDSLVETSDIDLEELLNPEALSIPEEWELPVDFSIPPVPDPDSYSENGYEDRSIRVHLETMDLQESVVHVARIEIASASQFRTATVAGVGSVRTDYMHAIAVPNHAVIAMNGDLFVEQSEGQKKTFEVRMGQIVTYDGKRNKTNNYKDILTVDRNGDFHLFIKSKGLPDYLKKHKGETVNAYTFGPALVVDGEIPKLDTNYAYNPNGRTSRSAIGQTGPLSYVFVIVEARGTTGKGVTHAQLAEIMKGLDCIQAYNLDGGNTAEMILMGPDPEYPLIHVRGDQAAGDYRRHSDIIYFATAVPESERE